MIEQAQFLDRRVHCLLGLPFDAIDMVGAVRLVQSSAVNHRRCFFSTPNLNFLISCQKDVAFRDSVFHSDLSVPDGMPLIWLSRLLKIPLRERVAGSGMFDALRADASHQMKVFFFGGPAGAAEAACQKLNATVSGTSCVGYESPGFGSVEQMSTDEIITHINASGADFLVVALPAKKGGVWIELNLARINVPVVSNLGAVVNFVAGSVRRAPRWMQRHGLEWLWRIKEEPQLWRRYLFDGIALLRLLITCVLPYAWFLRQHQPSFTDVSRAAVSIDMHSGCVLLKLQGAWISDNLDPLRAAFKSAVKDQMDVQLDMADVSYVDSAFIGLLMLLHVHQQQAGKRLAIVSVANSVRRIFKWSYADFLLVGDDSSGS